MSKKRNILVFIEHYIPGYKSGGPLQTIKNIQDVLGNEIDFSIVTLDRDLGSVKPYDGIIEDVWCKVGYADVLYLSPENVTFSKIRSLIQSKEYSAIYLNSFFSFKFSILPTIVYNLEKPAADLLIAPRGEFSPGALGIKSLKKEIYIGLAKFCGFFNYARFHASTEMEQKDVESVMGVDARVVIAKDLPNLTAPDLHRKFDAALESSAIQVCFVSRLVPKKNLDFAIDILALCKSEVQFVIFGSREDPSYWERCRQRLEKLPPNVSWRYGGELHPSDVKATFAEFDIFLFPTRGENYGHVIAEALLSGTFVLISDQTPWVGLDEMEVGRVIPLGQKAEFVRAIETLSSLPVQERFEKKLQIQEMAKSIVIDEQDVEDNRTLFSGSNDSGDQDVV